MPESARYCVACGHRISTFSIPRLLVLLPTVGWLLLSLLVISEPAPHLFLAFLWFCYTISLAGLWLVSFAPTAYRVVRSLGWRGASIGAIYLLPLPVAVAVIAGAWFSQLPMMARLDLSEGALVAYAESFDPKQPDGYHTFRFIGLFMIEHVHQSGGCTVFATSGFGIEDEAGIAYCTGPRPTCHGLDMEQIRDEWWTWSVQQSVC